MKRQQQQWLQYFALKIDSPLFYNKILCLKCLCGIFAHNISAFCIKTTARWIGCDLLHRFINLSNWIQPIWRVFSRYCFLNCLISAIVWKQPNIFPVILTHSRLASSAPDWAFVTSLLCPLVCPWRWNCQGLNRGLWIIHDRHPPPFTNPHLYILCPTLYW